MDNDHLLIFDRLVSASKYFTDTKYQALVDESVKAYDSGNFDSCSDLLNKLPTHDQLLATLIEKLNGKSVYKTLKLVKESKDPIRSPVITLKGLSSLMTHAIIEIEHGHKEYRMLIPKILERMSEIVL